METKESKMNPVYRVEAVLIGLALVLTQCGPCPEGGGGGGGSGPGAGNYDNPEVQKELSPYVGKFVANSQEQGKPTDISAVKFFMGSLNGPAGICRRGGGRAEVHVDKSVWGRLSDVQKEMLVHHELGHCTLQRGHNEETVDGREKSIMYPRPGQSSTYTQYYSSYIQELFANASKALDSIAPEDPGLANWVMNEGDDCDSMSDAEFESLGYEPGESEI